MKLSLLLSVASTVFAAGGVVDVEHCEPASVYLYQGHKEQHTSFDDSKAPILSVEQNQLVLADVAGTSRFHRYHSEEDARLVNTLIGKKSIFQRGDKNSVIVVVEGVEGQLMGVEPSYKIDETPDVEYFKDMYSQITNHLQQLSGKVRQMLTEGLDIIAEAKGSTLAKRGYNFEHKHSNALEADLAKIDSLSANLYKGDAALIHLDSLKKVSPSQYDIAAEKIRQSLEQMTKHNPFKVAVVTLPKNACGASGEMLKRDESESVDAEPKAEAPSQQHQPVLPGSFKDESECNALTNNCSGRGSCVKLARGGYACACKPTYNETTSKTTKWAGSACQKKDVSVETQMFLWTTIGILAVFIYGINLMMTVGNSPLPGVLTAGPKEKKAQ